MAHPDSPHARSWLPQLRFRRIITSNKFIPEIDGFRFLAILAVILPHLYLQCGPLPITGPIARSLEHVFDDGRRGVLLFFTISGFILALPFARHHLHQGSAVNLRNYFKRRITRLEPPYALALLFRLPALLLVKHASLAAVFPHFLASLVYLHSLIFGNASTINPPAWSLEVEVQFYIFAPLLAVVFRIPSKLLRRSLLLVFILVYGILASTVMNPGGTIALTLAFYLHFFIAGFLLADFYLSDDLQRIPKYAWDAIGLCMLAWIFLSTSLWYFTALPFAIIVLYLAGFYGRLLRSFFAFAPISIIGGMCYSIYLTHSTVLAFVKPAVVVITRLTINDVVKLWMVFTLCFSMILLIGGIFFLVIERPCMDPTWPHRLAERLRHRNRLSVQ